MLFIVQTICDLHYENWFEIPGIFLQLQHPTKENVTMLLERNSYFFNDNNVIHFMSIGISQMKICLKIYEKYVNRPQMGKTSSVCLLSWCAWHWSEQNLLLCRGRMARTSPPMCGWARAPSTLRTPLSPVKMTNKISLLSHPCIRPLHWLRLRLYKLAQYRSKRRANCIEK